MPSSAVRSMPPHPYHMEDVMAQKVKTFGMEIRPLETIQELKALDEVVNNFIADNGIKKLLSVSDMATTDDHGETIGIVRVIAYEQ